MPALPWSAPNYGLGIDPARAPFFVPGTVSPALIEAITRDREFRQQQLSGGIKDVVSAINKHMEQKQQDEIANQLMAQQGAQQATPVTPDTLYGEPNTVLSPQEQATNQALGYSTKPGTAPDRGGLFGFQLQQAAQKNQYQQALEQARTQHLMQLGYGGSGGGPAASVGQPPVPGAWWNGHQWVKPPTTARAAPSAGDNVVKQMATYGLTPQDLDNPDVAKLDIIEPKGTSGQKMSFATQDGKQATIPWATWQNWMNIRKQGGLNSPNQVAPAGRTTPNVGDVIRGYKFNGGDPADQNNWTPAQ